MVDAVKNITSAMYGVLMPKVLAEALNANLPDEDDPEYGDMPMDPQSASMLNDRLAQVTTQALASKLFGA